jgi:MFS family permease
VFRERQDPDEVRLTGSGGSRPQPREIGADHAAGAAGRAVPPAAEGEPSTTSAGGITAYLAVLSDGRIVRTFAASVVARLPIAMAPLGMVLLVQHVRGTYGPAGLVTGAYALGTAGGAPTWGRLMDRFGQPRVIAATATASATLLATLALGAVHGAGDAVLVALAVLAGLAFPPMSPAMRAAWRTFPDPQRRRGGYALDAVAVESIFVAGPLFLSLLLEFTAPVVPLLITAALLAGGGITYGATSIVRGIPGSRGHQRPVATAGGLPDCSVAARGTPAGAPAGVLRARGIPAALVVAAGLAVGFGQLDTSLAATARTVFGTNSVLGFLFAAIAGGSVIGGLTYGALTGHRGDARRLPRTLGAFGLLLLPLIFQLSHGRPSLWALEPLLFLAGLCIAPSLIILANLVDTHAPTGRASEAQAWLGTATTAGAAAGTALAGVLIDSGGVTRSFTGALIAVLIAAIAAAAGQRTWTGRHPTSRSRPA